MNEKLLGLITLFLILATLFVTIPTKIAVAWIVSPEPQFIHFIIRDDVSGNFLNNGHWEIYETVTIFIWVIPLWKIAEGNSGEGATINILKTYHFVASCNGWQTRTWDGGTYYLFPSLYDNFYMTIYPN